MQAELTQLNKKLQGECNELNEGIKALVADLDIERSENKKHCEMVA